MTAAPSRVAAIRAAYALEAALDALAHEARRQTDHALICASGIKEGEIWEAPPLAVLSERVDAVNVARSLLADALEALSSEVK